LRTIAICNQKGGTGKTTTAVNLAAALAEKGRKVLVLDLDPQGSTTAWIGPQEAQDDGRGLVDLLTGENGASLPSLALPTGIPGVDLVGSGTWLVSVDKVLAGQPGAEIILRNHVKALPRDRWDYMLIDGPPSLGLLAVSALTAVDEILIPLEPASMSLQGLVKLTATLDRVRERLNPDLWLSGILVCRVRGRTRLSQDVVKRLRERFKGQVFKTCIRETVRLTEAPSFQKPITQYDRKGRGAQDYRALAAEILKQEGGRHGKT